MIRNKSKKCRPRSKKWNVNITKYRQALDECFCESSASKSGVEFIHKHMLQAAEKAREDIVETHLETIALDAHITGLILERRQLKHAQHISWRECEDKNKSICKHILKLTRRRERFRRAFKIQQVLSAFRDLRRIPKIKNVLQKRNCNIAELLNKL